MPSRPKSHRRIMPDTDARPSEPTRRWLVAGRVQGVGFRWFVCRAAERLSLDGWVRNLIDGRVEAVACGPDLALDQMTAALSAGPSMSRVDEVRAVDPQTSIQSGSGFAARPNGPAGGLGDA